MSLRQIALLIAGTIAAMPLLGLAARAAPPASDDPRVTGPVTHGSLAIYLVRGKSAEGPVPLTLQEALEKGAIEVQETGNVQELRIENKGDAPVFVQLGDIVKGGRQDRVLTVSLLLQPRSGLVPIGAYCVEQGRWTARGSEDSRRFALSAALLPSRAAKLAIATPQTGSTAPAAPDFARPPRSPIEAELEGRRLRQAVDDLARRAGIDAYLQQRAPARPSTDGQSEVWRSVDMLQRNLSAGLAASVADEKSRTSLQLSLENEKLKSAVDAYVAALEAPGLADDDVLGVAVVIGGRIVGADRYPSNALFRKMWPKLVRAAATEAIAHKDDAAGPAPTADDVRAFLADVASGKPSDRAVGSIAQIETRDTAKAVRVRAMTGAASGGGMVHESYLSK